MNKKAVILGGSNGIGLAISCKLLSLGYTPVVLDLCPPGKELAHCEYHSFNLLDMDRELLRSLAADSEVCLLMLTAGIGRVAEFQQLHPVEIRKTLEIDAVASIEVFRYFYERFLSPEPFYGGIMGSIAGLVSSPLFSVYAAAKSAVCRFTESINIELEVHGTENRILNVSPGSLKGTRFNGGENDLSQTAEVAQAIVQKLFARETLYIPQYEETFRDVLTRYREDPHAYGLHSYAYKTKSGRFFNEERRVRIGYLSGTFDLFHVGHLNLIRRAKAQCDYLIVGVHPDASHKGKETFIPFEERMEIVGACKYVDRVVPSCREDSDAWNKWHFDRLFVGSDYKGTERFRRYEEFFRDKNVEIVYFPYTQSTSSTQIREAVQKE